MPQVSKHEVWSAIWNAKTAVDKAAKLVDTWLQQEAEGSMPHPHKKKKKPKK